MKNEKQRKIICYVNINNDKQQRVVNIDNCNNQRVDCFVQFYFNVVSNDCV